jgi:hypothetical protein
MKTQIIRTKGSPPTDSAHQLGARPRTLTATDLARLAQTVVTTEPKTGEYGTYSDRALRRCGVPTKYLGAVHALACKASELRSKRAGTRTVYITDLAQRLRTYKAWATCARGERAKRDSRQDMLRRATTLTFIGWRWNGCIGYRGRSECALRETHPSTAIPQRLIAELAACGERSFSEGAYVVCNGVAEEVTTTQIWGQAPNHLAMRFFFGVDGSERLRRLEMPPNEKLNNARPWRTKRVEKCGGFGRAADVTKESV